MFKLLKKLINTDNPLIYSNTLRVNVIINRLLFITALIPVIFIILSISNVWFIPYRYSIILEIYLLCCALIQFFLNHSKKENCQIISVFFGLLASAGLVGFLGHNSSVTITIAFGLIPFLSCLYCSQKLTICTCIFSYLELAASLYVRSRSITSIITYANHVQTPDQWYISTMIGFSVEFFFASLLSYILSRRTDRSLKNVISSNSEKENALKELGTANADIERYIEELKQSSQEKEKIIENLSDTQYYIIEFIAQILGSHDLFTGRHVIHTQTYVALIANKMRELGFYADELTEETINNMKTAAYLHDIGKIHIPEGILNKNGQYTQEEFELMRCHPEEGAKLLDFLPLIDDGRFNKIAEEMALCHHEKWDGSGYPYGLKGLDIPLSARIMAAADVLDALLSQRLYKKAMSIEDTIQIFQSSSGTHFEPCIVEAVMAVKDDIDKYDRSFKETESATNEEEQSWWDRYHAIMEQK